MGKNVLFCISFWGGSFSGAVGGVSSKGYSSRRGEGKEFQVKIDAKFSRLYIFLTILFERYLTIGEVQDIMKELNEVIASNKGSAHPFVQNLSHDVINELFDISSGDSPQA